MRRIVRKQPQQSRLGTIARAGALGLGVLAAGCVVGSNVRKPDDITRKTLPRPYDLGRKESPHSTRTNYLFNNVQPGDILTTGRNSLRFKITSMKKGYTYFTYSRRGSPKTKGVAKIHDFHRSHYNFDDGTRASIVFEHGGKDGTVAVITVIRPKIN